MRNLRPITLWDILSVSPFAGSNPAPRILFIMNTKQTIQTLSTVYSEARAWMLTALGAFLLGILFFLFTNFALIRGNLGLFHAVTIVILQTIIALLFGINMALLGHKVTVSMQTNKTAFGGTAFGAFLSLLVIGCPACSITLASYLGLATFVTALPFFGIELKILSLGLLLYSTRTLLHTATTCAVPKHTNSKK